MNLWMTHPFNLWKLQLYKAITHKHINFSSQFKFIWNTKRWNESIGFNISVYQSTLCRYFPFSCPVCLPDQAFSSSVPTSFHLYHLINLQEAQYQLPLFLLYTKYFNGHRLKSKLHRHIMSRVHPAFIYTIRRTKCTIHKESSMLITKLSIISETSVIWSTIHFDSSPVINKHHIAAYFNNTFPDRSTDNLQPGQPSNWSYFGSFLWPNWAGTLRVHFRVNIIPVPKPLYQTIIQAALRSQFCLYCRQYSLSFYTFSTNARAILNLHFFSYHLTFNVFSTSSLRLSKL